MKKIYILPLICGILSINSCHKKTKTLAITDTTTLLINKSLDQKEILHGHVSSIDQRIYSVTRRKFDSIISKEPTYLSEYDSYREFRNFHINFNKDRKPIQKFEDVVFFSKDSVNYRQLTEYEYNSKGRLDYKYIYRPIDSLNKKIIYDYDEKGMPVYKTTFYSNGDTGTEKYYYDDVPAQISPPKGIITTIIGRPFMSKLEVTYEKYYFTKFPNHIIYHINSLESYDNKTLIDSMYFQYKDNLIQQIQSYRDNKLRELFNYTYNEKKLVSGTQGFSAFTSVNGRTARIPYETKILYEYDNMNNWTTAIIYYAGVPESVIKRKISYFK